MYHWILSLTLCGFHLASSLAKDPPLPRAAPVHFPDEKIASAEPYNWFEPESEDELNSAATLTMLVGNETASGHQQHLFEYILDQIDSQNVRTNMRHKDPDAPQNQGIRAGETVMEMVTIDLRTGVETTTPMSQAASQKATQGEQTRRPFEPRNGPAADSLSLSTERAPQVNGQPTMDGGLGNVTDEDFGQPLVFTDLAETLSKEHRKRASLGTVVQSGYSSFPYSATVKLYMVKNNGAVYVCSGSMVSDFHVITAGHCVHDGQSGTQTWASQILVVPAHHDHYTPVGFPSRKRSVHYLHRFWVDMPYGWAWAAFMSTFNGWIINEEWDWDVGVIRLDRPIGTRTGYYGLTQSTYSSVNQLGYPAGSRYPPAGVNNVHHYGSVTLTEDEIIEADTFCEGGNSGGPGYALVDGSRYIFSVVSYAYVAGDTPCGLSRTSSAKWDVIMGWIDESVGVPDNNAFIVRDLEHGTFGLSSSEVALGQSLVVGYALQNVGWADSGTLTLKVIAVSDTSWTPDTSNAWLLYETTQSSLSSWSYRTNEHTFSMPTIPSGSYFIFLRYSYTATQYGRDSWTMRDIFLGEVSVECATDCLPGWETDSICDAPCRNSACGYDDGACDAVECVSDSQCSSGNCGGFCCDSPSCFECSSSGACLDCNAGCPSYWIGDDFCDTSCRVAACSWDADDCDGYTCSSDSQCSSGHCASGYCCDDSVSSACTACNTGGSCADCSVGCASSWIDDNLCDEACRTSACSYDGDDCTNVTCTSDSQCPSGHCAGGYCCAPGLHSCSACNGAGDCLDCNEGCPDSWIGDAICDAACNVSACGFDYPDCEPEGHACQTAASLSVGSLTQGSTISSYSATFDTCGTSYDGSNVFWYSFISPSDTVGTMRVSLCGSAFDTKVSVFAGTCGSPSCLGGNDDFDLCGLSSDVCVRVSPNTTYFVAVHGYGGTAGDFQIMVDDGCGCDVPGEDEVVCHTLAHDFHKLSAPVENCAPFHLVYGQSPGWYSTFAQTTEDLRSSPAVTRFDMDRPRPAVLYNNHSVDAVFSSGAIGSLSPGETLLVPGNAGVDEGMPRVGVEWRSSLSARATCMAYRVTPHNSDGDGNVGWEVEVGQGDNARPVTSGVGSSSDERMVQWVEPGDGPRLLVYPYGASPHASVNDETAVSMQVCTRVFSDDSSPCHACDPVCDYFDTDTGTGSNCARQWNDQWYLTKRYLTDMTGGNVVMGGKGFTSVGRSVNLVGCCATGMVPRATVTFTHHASGFETGDYVLLKGSIDPGASYGYIARWDVLPTTPTTVTLDVPSYFHSNSTIFRWSNGAAWMYQEYTIDDVIVNVRCLWPEMEE
uniref:Peptidase S1 domain-containing protein n=1 Tax=Sexangularia sp. CB-2014 TaxID=1486929 RepID=A0A7S1VK64_9EUKA